MDVRLGRIFQQPGSTNPSIEYILRPGVIYGRSLLPFLNAADRVQKTRRRKIAVALTVIDSDYVLSQVCKYTSDCIGFRFAGGYFRHKFLYM